MTAADLAYAVVVPTVGRPSLDALLASLARQEHPPAEVVVVDDRPPGGPGEAAGSPLGAGVPEGTPWQPRVLRSYGRGPAAARNRGWRATSAPWVVFLDDDVLLPGQWSAGLRDDLLAAAETTGGVQARLRVPLPGEEDGTGRRPTDWERGTRGLEGAAWATADMAYRRAALAVVHGFDERFPRAFREDADLALRVTRAGWRLVRGSRTTLHPVRPSDRWASLRQQRGNADDATCRRLHGRGWRQSAQAPRGRLPWHVATVAAAVAALGGLAAGRPRVAATGSAAWLALTADFTLRRVLPGPRTRDEVVAMTLTSLAIPPAAVWHRLRGEVAARRLAPWPPPVEAVLFDRDGTLVHDVPYNGDPAQVRPVAGARRAVRRLRAAGLPVGAVTNQSGIARGLLDRGRVDAVNAAVEAEVGRLDTWQVCPHGPDDGCACRKPAPGMVRAAAAELGVPVERCGLVGDIGADVEAALAAGARPVLVPTAETRAEEVAAAPYVAADLDEALDLLGVPAPGTAPVDGQAPVDAAAGAAP